MNDDLVMASREGVLVDGDPGPRATRLVAAALIVVLTMFSGTAFVGQLINWLIVIAIGIVMVRRAIASRRFATLERDRWQSQMANWMAGVWPSLAVQLGLEVRTYNGQKLVTGAGRPTWHGDTCILPVSMPAGLAREDLVAASGRIAQAFNAIRVTVTGEHLSQLALRIDYVDALTEPFSFPLGGTWDGASVLMGVTDEGEEWRLPLGPHTLVAGSSGSGKASLVWGLLLGLVQPIHSGLVEVWGVRTSIARSPQAGPTTSRVRVTVDAARSSRASALSRFACPCGSSSSGQTRKRGRCPSAHSLQRPRAGVAQLIIERDESLERAERRQIADVIRHAGSSEMQYRHVAPHEYPLLWVSDAVAWCYSNSGDWIRRVDAMVESRVTRL